jgi:TPP-dependent pyruvate/acetoin dehydrogenase alpha subunit
VISSSKVDKGVSVDAHAAEHMLRTMLLIRRVEEAMIDCYRRNLVPGFIHPAIGEEAVHAGVGFHLEPRDHVVGTHRGHGVALAKGTDPKRMLAEVLGKQDGLLEGRGGSLHVGDWSIGCLPASPLVGGGIATMTGLGLAHKLDKDGGVAVCFFGDGAVNRGSFAEAVNMAAIWQLPVIYAVIDNGWAISVPRSSSTAGDLVERARSYGMPGVRVDGKDIEACHAAAGESIERARDGGGPSVLVFDCPRGYGHEEGDAQEYRPKDDYEQAQVRDPVRLSIARFIELGFVSQDGVDKLDLEVRNQVAEAVAFALESPLPLPEMAFRHVRPSQAVEGARQ